MEMAKVKMKETMRLNPTGGRNCVIDAKEGDIVEIRKDFVEDMGDKIEVLVYAKDKNYADIITTAQTLSNPELPVKDEDVFDTENFVLEDASIDELRKKAKEFGLDARGNKKSLIKKIKEKASELTRIDEEEISIEEGLEELDHDELLANISAYYPEVDVKVYEGFTDEQLREYLKEGLADDERVKAVEKSLEDSPENKSLGDVKLENK